MSVTARDGYSVGVIALDGPVETSPDLLAAGIATGISVSDGQVTQVALSVEPLGITLTQVPALLQSGEVATIKGKITGAAVAAERFSVTLCLDTVEFDTPCEVATPPGGTLSADSFDVTFTVPTVTADATLWYQFIFGVDAREGWSDGNVAARIALPSMIIGDTLFWLPVNVGTGSLEIVFSDRRGR